LINKRQNDGSFGLKKAVPWGLAGAKETNTTTKGEEKREERAAKREIKDWDTMVTLCLS